MKVVVIYPGRFQPMLSHHVDAYRKLKAQFAGADVYFGTSNKVELPDSPFNFRQKQQIAKAHGIDPNLVLQAKSPYSPSSYTQFDEDNTILVFAVGEKDMERFPFDNVSPENGLQMKKDGQEPSYFQKIESIEQSVRPMTQRGYVTLIPNVMSGRKVASASDFRDAMNAAPDKEAAKIIFTKQFGEYNEAIFNLIYNNTVGIDQMNEELEEMKKLAGLDYIDIKPKEAKHAAARPGKALRCNAMEAKFFPPDQKMFKSTIRKSVANRFPEGADLTCMETRKDVFMTELVRGPVTLLGEINARLTNDEDGLAMSDRLSSIIGKLDEMSVMSLPAEEKKFVFEMVANALRNMDLVRHGKEEHDPADAEIESVDFDDLREEFDLTAAEAAELSSKKSLAEEESWHDLKDSMVGSITNKMQMLGVWNQALEAAGPEQLKWAIESQAEEIADRYHGSGDGIGSSDVNHCIQSVGRSVGIDDLLGWNREVTEDSDDCPKCHGTGDVAGTGEYEGDSMNCPECHGSGLRMDESDCKCGPNCHCGPDCKCGPDCDCNKVDEAFMPAAERDIRERIAALMDIVRMGRVDPETKAEVQRQMAHWKDKLSALTQESEKDVDPTAAKLDLDAPRPEKKKEKDGYSYECHICDGDGCQHCSWTGRNVLERTFEEIRKLAGL